MNQAISFSTAQAAQYLGIQSHVLHSNFKRHGGYLGIVPRKGSGGRLCWPADEVRDASLPPFWEMPDGGPLLLEVISRICPAIETKDAYRLVLYFLGCEALPGWKPVSGQTPESIRKEDLAIALMIHQAALDGDDWAATKDVAADSGVARVAGILAKRLSFYADSGESA